MSASFVFKNPFYYTIEIRILQNKEKKTEKEFLGKWKKFSIIKRKRR
ncbi:hypothetical protein HMPREF1987_02108 [Peptostreptococcaceae bacterium oral taxon 113 str. W5053]|nr:hypothetical protein HMPREF1987_02108 [Peptostreptococcaceae bacterium oral taxon 113 str. W5053]